MTTTISDDCVSIPALKAAYWEERARATNFLSIIDSVRALLVAKRPDLSVIDLALAVGCLISENKTYAQRVAELEARAMEAEGDLAVLEAVGSKQPVWRSKTKQESLYIKENN